MQGPMLIFALRRPQLWPPGSGPRSFRCPRRQGTAALERSFAGRECWHSVGLSTPFRSQFESVCSWCPPFWLRRCVVHCHLQAFAVSSRSDRVRAGGRMGPRRGLVLPGRHGQDHGCNSRTSVSDPDCSGKSSRQDRHGLCLGTVAFATGSGLPRHRFLRSPDPGLMPVMGGWQRMVPAVWFRSCPVVRPQPLTAPAVMPLTI